MQRSICALILSTTLPWVLSAAGADPKPATKPDSKKPAIEMVEMTLHPALPPRQALKHRLLPPPLDRQPGNAATLYMKALLMMETTRLRSALKQPINELMDKKLSLEKLPERLRELDHWNLDWLSAPLDQLPRDEVRKTLNSFKIALHSATLASRRMQCDWALPMHEVENPYAILLPEVPAARSLAQILALKARLKMAEGDYEEALLALQTGYALARHIAEQSTMVSSMMGRAIADIMTAQLETLIQLPEVPNLYWSVTALPHPVIDLQKGIDFEELAVYLAFPEFQEARRGPHTPDQWQALLDGVFAKYRDVASLAFDETPEQIPTVKEFLHKALPVARKEMIARGRAKEEVDAMPPAQVVLLHVIETHEELRDEAFKWFHVPYWQAHQGMQEAQHSLETAGRRLEVLPLASMLVPAVGNWAYFSTISAERRLAALRCIEAVRLYAATHDGKLPKSLDDVTEVPIPINPVTGEPFPYRVEGDTAILEELSLDEMPPQRRYRMRLAEQ